MQTLTDSEVDLAPREPRLDGVMVKVLRTIEEIENIREFWSSSNGILDSDIDVFLAKPASAPEGLQLRVFVLYRNGNPVALMAGTILRERFVFRLGWLALFKPLVNVLTIRGGLRGDGSLDNCREFVRALLDSLRHGDADLAFLPQLETDSLLFALLRSETGFLLRDHIVPLRLHRIRKLPRTVEELYDELSANGRMTFRRIVKRLDRDFAGDVRFERIDGFNSVTDLQATLMAVDRIARTTWQYSMASGLHLTVSQMEAFKKQAECGWLRVYILHLAQKPCAFLIGAIYRGTFYAEYTGYDPSYAKYSLGTFMLSRIMEESCAEGINAIDFASSDEDYKKRFSNHMWSEADVHVFAPSRLGLMLGAMETIRALLNEPARALLKHVDLMQKVKRIWRRAQIWRSKTNTIPASCKT